LDLSIFSNPWLLFALLLAGCLAAQLMRSACSSRLNHEVQKLAPQVQPTKQPTLFFSPGRKSPFSSPEGKKREKSAIFQHSFFKALGEKLLLCTVF
jgi:hypothetical protein